MSKSFVFIIAMRNLSFFPLNRWIIYMIKKEIQVNIRQFNTLLNVLKYGQFSNIKKLSESKKNPF